MENDVFKVFMMSNEDPIYVSATVKFNNHTWWHVGIRYKGQSTLTGAMMSMSHKYPFRLNFDKFEDDYPEIDNQRFYGFDELIFNNNWYDPSFLRINSPVTFSAMPAFPRLAVLSTECTLIQETVLFIGDYTQCSRIFRQDARISIRKP